MPASWVDTEFYDGDDVDAEGNLWGLAGAYGLNDAADVQLAKVMSFVSRFPKPVAGKGVRADAILSALRELIPLARKVATLTDGATKRGLLSRIFGPGGQGTLTGEKVTAADKATANRIIYEVETRLPQMGAGAIDVTLYAQIKETAHQLLKIGSDIGDSVGDIIDNFSRAMDASSSALVDLPDTVLDVMARGANITRDVVCNSPAGDFMWACWQPWKKVVVVTAGVAIGSALLYGIYKILRAAAPVAVNVAAKRYGISGISGIGDIRRTKSGRSVVCFKARKGRSRKRREVCFPARHRT